MGHGFKLIFVAWTLGLGPMLHALGAVVAVVQIATHLRHAAAVPAPTPAVFPMGLQTAFHVAAVTRLCVMMIAIAALSGIVGVVMRGVRMSNAEIGVTVRQCPAMIFLTPAARA